MAEYLEIPQFVVSPPNFEVLQQSLSVINSEAELLPQISGLGLDEQVVLLEQWYALHDPTYVSMQDYDDIFFSTNAEDLKRFAEQGLKDIYDSVGATEAAKEWIVEGGKVTGTGAATVGGKISYDYASSLAASSSGTTAMSVLSMNLPTAAAAMAPLIGFALGWTLYELSPEFWTKVSKALLPFCYEDTELMPVMADDKGNTYFPKDAVAALGEVLSTAVTKVATAGNTNLSHYVNPTPFSFTENVSVCNMSFLGTEYKFEVSGTGVSAVAVVNKAGYYGDTYGYIFASKNKFDLTYTVTRDGVVGDTKSIQVTEKDSVYSNGDKYYYAYLGAAFGNDKYVIFDPVAKITMDNGNVSPLVADAMIYGVQEEIIDGVKKWTGVNYPSDIDEISILGPINDGRNDYHKIPYIPIATPHGKPGESVQSTVSDLTTNPNPNEALSPWITSKPDPSTYPEGVSESKKPAPLPSILPNPTIVADPNENPSTRPEEEPQPEPNSQVPTDSGVSNQVQNPDSIPFLPGDGIVHVYNPTATELRAFGSWLWRTFSGDIIETVSKLFNNPMDSLIGLHELYASPNIAGTENIKCGYLTSDIASKYVGNRYSTINCGSIVVPEFYNNYLDYSPYTKCFIYLPFVGIVPVHADDIIGNAVNIMYNVDAYTGSCIAVVTVAREGYSSTVYQFQGNCAAELPISSGYHSALMAGLLGVAGTAISGNPHVGLSAANLGRASLGKNEVSHSGSFGATYGAMGAKNPYIIVKRPTQRSVVNYNQDYGFPAHKRVTIGACSGYLRAREVHVISPTATDDEKARIEELLKEGVFVK